MADPTDGTAGTGAPDDSGTGPDPTVRLSGDLVDQAPGGSRFSARRFGFSARRFIGPVAGGIGIVLVVVGGLGFLTASNDHSARDAADAKRRTIHAAEVRAVNAQARIQREADAVASQVDSLTSSANALTDAANAIVTAFDGATNQNNNGDVAGAQAAYAAQANAVAALDPKLAAVRQALGQAQQRLSALQAEGR